MRLHSSFAISLLSAAAVSGFVTRPRFANSPAFCRRQTEANLSPFPLHDIGMVISQDTIETSKNLLQTYKNLLIEDPITTKSITSAILASVGDFIAQYRSSGEDEPFQYDIQRGICFLGFGALYTGAFQHFWFQFLSSHISEWGEVLKVWGPSRVSIPVDDMYSLNEWWMYFDVVSGLENPPSDTALAAGKLVANQFLMIPGFYMPIFFALTGALAKLNPKESIARAQSMYLPLLKRNYVFWLPLQFIQFLVIPAEWQIPFLSVISLVWTVILSSIAGSSEPSSQSQVVAYETTSGDEIQVSQVVTNYITDDVSYEDIEKALIPQAARDALSDPKVGATTAAGAFALLAAAADDGLLGEVVANTLGAEVGAGVFALTAIGAGIGLLTASQTNNEGEDAADETLELPEEEMMNIKTDSFVSQSGSTISSSAQKGKGEALRR